MRGELLIGVLIALCLGGCDEPSQPTKVTGAEAKTTEPKKEPPPPKNMLKSPSKLARSEFACTRRALAGLREIDERTKIEAFSLVEDPNDTVRAHHTAMRVDSKANTVQVITPSTVQSGFVDWQKYKVLSSAKELVVAVDTDQNGARVMIIDQSAGRAIEVSAIRLVGSLYVSAYHHECQ